jgi:hypothetical protein
MTKGDKQMLIKSLAKTEKQVRRQRRQRRSERAAHRSINGWTVRTW